jgi:hypothetical protein
MYLLHIQIYTLHYSVVFYGRQKFVKSFVRSESYSIYNVKPSQSVWDSVDKHFPVHQATNKSGSDGELPSWPKHPQPKLSCFVASASSLSKEKKGSKYCNKA